MTSDLDHELSLLKVWLCDAWRRISDPSMTAFDRRELRNYMKEAEAAMRVGLKRSADRERSRYEAVRNSPPAHLPKFRIMQLVGLNNILLIWGCFKTLGVGS